MRESGRRWRVRMRGGSPMPSPSVALCFSPRRYRRCARCGRGLSSRGYFAGRSGQTRRCAVSRRAQEIHHSMATSSLPRRFAQRPSGCCWPAATCSRPACMPVRSWTVYPTPRIRLARVVATTSHLRVLAAAGDLHLAEHAFESVCTDCQAVPCTVASGTRQADLARRTAPCRPDA